VSDGLRDALKPEWRGGVTGSVINDCLVKKGDFVSWSLPTIPRGEQTHSNNDWYS